MGVKHLCVEVFDMNSQICNVATYRYFRQPGGRRTKNFGGKNFGEIFQDFSGKNFGEQFLVNNVYSIRKKRTVESLKYLYLIKVRENER